MFQATRQRLALWYTAVTAVLLLLFASGFYLYVRTTLVERVDDTLNHVVEIIERSLVIEPSTVGDRVLASTHSSGPPLQVNVEASFRNNQRTVEDDRIDLEWFDPTGQLRWSTLAEVLPLPLHVNPAGETVHVSPDVIVRQITERVQVHGQVLGYLRVSHPWFEVTKPSRRLLLDLALGTSLMVGTITAIGWWLSGLAMAPVGESYQQLRQFTADASHELRNPIAVIQTNVQVALSDPDPDPTLLLQQFQVIERLTRRLGSLVEDLLFLARQESGLMPPVQEVIDLDLLLAEVTEEQQAIAQERNISLSFDHSATSQPLAPLPSAVELAKAAHPWTDNVSVMGDPSQLCRLFTNLISNAVQYTPLRGRVTVATRAVKHQGQPTILITVNDTGIGMDAETLAHAFDRFYRADPARMRSSSATGTGLGLAIAKAIVENHRGHIDIQSQPGRGTTVSILLPMAPK
jgi:OmpR-family two-component system manganese-sensing sensor histidine kinase